MFPNNQFGMNQFPNNNLNMVNMNMNNINNNNFFNPFLMNNQFPMIQMNPINQMMQLNQINQMNQINQINQMNQMNQMMKPNNNYFINPNQKLLVDKIIYFYKKNNRSYMNYNEPNQIKQLLNHLDTTNPMLKEGNDISDPFPYINEKKKIIKFINHDLKIFNVKVPVSIDKKTLYQIATLYKTFKPANILLVYMNCILYEDESSIESISDGDFVIIIEDIYYLDDTYYNLLNNQNYIGEKKNVNF